MKHTVNLTTSSFILSNYRHLLNGNNESVEKIGSDELKIPSFSEDMLINLCNSAIDVLKQKNQTLIKIEIPAIVIGDLHGNLHDLIRIMNSIDDIFTNNLLFLGDYVDRGQFQIETITLLLALRIEYPDNFFLIRGNHEFIDINATGGFKDEILNAGYSETLFEKFNEAFFYLPIAALIDDQIFCVHGGLSPQFQKIEQINTEFKLPIKKISQNSQKKIQNNKISESVEIPEKRSPPINFSVNKPHRFSDSYEYKALAMNIPPICSPVESRMQPFVGSTKLSHENKSKSLVYSKLPSLNQQSSQTNPQKNSNNVITIPPHKSIVGASIPTRKSISPLKPISPLPIPPIRPNSNLNQISPLKQNLYQQHPNSARLNVSNDDDRIDDKEDEKSNIKLLTDLLWSDPSNLTDFFLPSNRGSGWYFGFIATNTFLQKNDMKLIVRGHESIKKGVELNHEKKIMTVFSSSSMSNGGLAGCVVFDTSNSYKIYKFDPIDVIQRIDAKFFEPIVKHYHKIESLSMCSLKRYVLSSGKVHKTKSIPQNLKESLS